MLNTIWELLINIFESIIYTYFVCSLLSQKQKITHKAIQYTSLFSCIFAVTTLKYILNFPNYLSLFLMFSIGSIVNLFIYDTTTFYTLLINGVFILYSIISESILLLMPVLFDMINTTEIINTGVIHYLFTLLYIIILFLFTFITIHYKKNLIFNREEKLMFIVLCIIEIFISEFSIVTLVSLKKNSYKSTYTNLEIITFLTIISMFIFIFLLLKLGKTKYDNLTLLEKQNEQKQQAIELQMLMEATKNLRIMKHDLANHIAVSKKLLQSNIDELLNYWNAYELDIKNTNNLISSGNPIVDCVVTSKLETAKNEGIHTIHSIFLPNKMPIENLHLSSILSNLFNNAIEACKRIDSNETKKIIEFYIKPQRQMLEIYMKNSYNGILYQDKQKRGHFLSSKKDTTSPISSGLGLQSIRQIVDKYQGIVHITPTDMYFCIYIYIPLDE